MSTIKILSLLEIFWKTSAVYFKSDLSSSAKIFRIILKIWANSFESDQGSSTEI